MKKPIDEQVFKDVIGGLLARIEKETEHNFSSLINQLKNIDMESFDIHILFPLENCVDIIHKSKDAGFIYFNYGFIENSFNELIELREGSPCCVDKSRHIIRRLYKEYEFGEEFKLEGNNYWITKTLTVENCRQFFVALQAVHYGKHLPLMNFYNSLVPNDKTPQETI